MLLSTRIKLVLALWFVGEALVFVLVAQLTGYPLAFLLGIATSFVGAGLLKRAGASAMLKFRAALDGRRVDDAPPGRVLDDTLATLGALALILPGFLSDLIGAVLATPAFRVRVTGWIDRRGLGRFRPGGRGRRGPSTIDLSPEEWRSRDPASRPISKV